MGHPQRLRNTIQVCHPERSEGPMQFADAGKVHRSFVAKSAPQDDKVEAFA